MTPWITVIGIGEDGPDGLGDKARALIGQARILVGGARHLAMIPAGRQERLVWPQPFAAGLDMLEHHRGSPVAILASGDPQWFGVGVSLARRFGGDALTVIPHSGAFSLAAARLGWALQDIFCLSIHGRPFAEVGRHLHPGSRLLVLSEDGGSPARLAAYLDGAGLGNTRMTVFERLGGPNECRLDDLADRWGNRKVEDLNIVALALPDDLRRFAAPTLLAGLPDDAYEHDGQLTKREIRAVTLASLAPWPGALLFDIGAGAGSIAIEWCRAGGRATAIERRADRLALIERNRDRLGAVGLSVLAGEARLLMADLKEAPDAIFIGGGLTEPGLAEACWERLKPGGRLVANAVTAEGEAILLAWQAGKGGDLSRIAVSRLAGTGRFHSWHPLAPVTHYLGMKS